MIHAGEDIDVVRVARAHQTKQQPNRNQKTSSSASSSTRASLSIEHLGI
jgi:hypothetical protein